MAKGDHIRVRRGFYDHHGIDCGDGCVIHYNGSPLRRRGARVTRSTLAEFSRGSSTEVVHACPSDTADDVIERAMSRLGESLYHLVWNNCEHFAWWCLTGKSRSRQVERVAAGVVTVAAAACVAVITLATRPGLHRMRRSAE